MVTTSQLHSFDVSIRTVATPNTVDAVFFAVVDILVKRETGRKNWLSCDNKN